MKALPRILCASLLASLLLLPVMAASDQLPAPLEKTILPGTTTISYAGQNLRFTTEVHLRVKLLAISPTQTAISVRVHGGIPVNPAPGDDAVEIYWSNFDEDLYSGPPPTEEWGGVLNSESGFTEK